MGCGASKSTLGSQQHQQNVPLPVAREEQETHVSEIENGRAAECGPKVAKWNGGKVTPAIEADEPALFNTRPSAAKAIASSITAAVAAASTEVGCRKTTEQPHQLSAAERRAVQFDGASSDTDEEAGEEMDSPTGALIARLDQANVREITTVEDTDTAPFDKASEYSIFATNSLASQREQIMAETKAKVAALPIFGCSSLTQDIETDDEDDVTPINASELANERARSAHSAAMIDSAIAVPPAFLS